MAERSVNVVSPAGPGSIPESKLVRAEKAGARVMTDDERAGILDEHAHDTDVAEAWQAEALGKVRGVGESVGFPVDAAAMSVADQFGKGAEARAYVNNLRKYHPLASGYGELAGQAGGSIAMGEVLGGGAARAPTAAARMAEATASGAVRGGLENLVIGSTHDVNEAHLGNADAAGEKLLAEMPKHFMVGALGGAVGGAAFSAAGEALTAAKPVIANALNRGADAAVGRELGGGAALGAEIRGRMGHVPSSSSEVADMLGREQAGYRQAAQAEAQGARSALEASHTTQAWEQSAKGEAQRLASAREAKAAVEAVERRHEAARTALASEQAEATGALEKLSTERAGAQKQIRHLAADLDKVKGAEFPRARNITDAAVAKFTPDPLVPPSPRATELFQQWADAFQAKYAQPGKLNFSELQNVIHGLDVMERRQRVVSGWGSDPDVKNAFAAMKTAAKEEFDRASGVTASTVSEASGLHAERLRSKLPELDTAVEQAEQHLERIGKATEDFERGAVQEVTQAERAGFASMRTQDKIAGKEARILDRNQRAELRGLPKADKATPVDALLRQVRAPKEASLMPAGAIGAGVSLLQGNVAGAAMSLIGGFAANTARAKGNLLAARTLASLSETIAKADGSIARYAGRAVGRYARQAAEVAGDRAPARPRLTFEKAAQRVRETEANPLILEQRVRSVAGPWAQSAPQVYSSLLSAAMRSQAFLASKLPPDRSDPYSLTPHLENNDLSDSEKYDFVQYAKAVADPVSVLKDVADGSVTPQQVEALQAVYPALYKQMTDEVRRRVASLESPLDYEKSVNIGVLLGVDTNEVMTAEYQSMQADMYMSRAKSEELPGGSKPKGVNSRLSKSMSSASQQMQMGDA